MHHIFPISYDDKTNDKPLLDLFHNKSKPDPIPYCKTWLQHFNTWKDFVEKNYLADFTEGGEEEGYNILPFWAEHSHKCHDLPSDENDFLKYLQLLNNLIEKRNARVCNEVYKNSKTI